MYQQLCLLVLMVIKSSIKQSTPPQVLKMVIQKHTKDNITYIIIGIFICL